MKKEHKPVIIWLGLICLMVFLMVIVGGVTRLTHSGLSMVEWRPLIGIIPPFGEAQWMEVFNKYKQFPEYQKINIGMTLSEFKGIFYWEYGHRVLGRLVGMVFFFPWVIFLIQKRIERKLNLKLLLLFILGGSQGLLGWYMVKSGLVNDPNVSHYRLASHLGLAFIICGYGFWIMMDLMNPNQIKNEAAKSMRIWALVITALTSVQIVYGAFVAGLKAGFMYNTFPKMNGEWIPSVAFDLSPFILNFLENHAMVQFMHRVVAWLLLFSVLAFFFVARTKNLSVRQARSILFMMLMVIIQFALGVWTLLATVPVSLGATHQAGACVFFIIMIYVIHSFSGSKNTI
jgi:cytochrome c oxidase assembly protein subunit 15